MRSIQFEKTKVFRKVAFVLLLLSTTHFNGISQDSEINTIRERYVGWINGAEVDYSRPEIMIRYNYILDGYEWASDFSYLDFDDPGALWDLTSGPDKSAFRTIGAKLVELCIIYSIEGPVDDPNPHYDEPTVRALILDVFDYIEAKGVDGDTYYGDYYSEYGEWYGLGGTALIRSAGYATSILLMREDLLVTDRLAHHLEALDNITFYWSPENPYFDFGWTGTNADGIKSIGEGRLIYILCQEDGTTDRIEDMEHYVAFFNNGLAIASGWRDMIKPDFMTYHHRGAYPSNYGATGILAASAIQWILDDSPYEISTEASDNIKNVLLTYKKYTLGYSLPSTITGRFPTNTEYSVFLTSAYAHSFISNPSDNIECGEEFTRLFEMDSLLITSRLIKERGMDVSLYHTLGGMQLMLDALDEDLGEGIIPTGNFQFPYAGLSVNKTENWMVSQKGTSKHIWHYEGTNVNNAFGRYNSAGYMEILTNNAPLPRLNSGLSWNGYDWSHRPGTSVHYLTLDEIYEEVNNDRKSNSKDFLTNAQFDNSGAFSMDYEDINSPDWMSLKKSSFFFDDYVVCLTNDIANTDDIHPLHSTIFQTALQDVSAYTHVGSDSINGLGYDLATIEDGMGFTDGANNAYYVHDNSGDSLHIVRRHQNSISQNGSTPTEGDFVNAWIDHGIAPDEIELVYCIQVNGGKSGMENLTTNFDDLFEVLALEEDLHAVQYLADSTTGITAFEANESINIGHVLGIDSPGLVFTKPIESNRLKVGFTDPNMGLLEDGEWYPMNSTPIDVVNRIPVENGVTVTILEEWELETGSDNVTVYFNGTDTELTFTTKNSLSEICVLRKPTHVGIQDENLSVLKVYPTPANDWIVMSKDSQECTTIRLYCLTGAVIREWKVDEGERVMLDVSGISPGIYQLVTYLSDKPTGGVKIVKL